MELFKIFGVIEIDDKKAVSQLNNVTNTAAKGSAKMASSFSMAKGVFGGIFSAQILSQVMNFFGKSIEAAESAQKEWRMIANQAEIAGYKWDDIKTKVEAFSQAMIELGFDDEDAATSLTRLLRVTKDYESAVSLATVAADLAASKGISMTDASIMLSRALAGNVRILKEYGIKVSATATQQEVLDAIIKNTAGSAQAAATGIAVTRVKVAELSEELGNKLLPIIETLISGNLPNMLFAFFSWIADALSGLSNIVTDFSSAWRNMQINLGFTPNKNEIKSLVSMMQQTQAAMDNIKKHAGVKNALDLKGDDLAEYKKLQQVLLGMQQRYRDLNQEAANFYGEQEKRNKKVVIAPPPKVLSKQIKLRPNLAEEDDEKKDPVDEQKKLVDITTKGIESTIKYQEQAYRVGLISIEQLQEFYDKFGEEFWDSLPEGDYTDLANEIYFRKIELRNQLDEDQAERDDKERKRLQDLADDTDKINKEMADSIKKHNEEVQEGWVNFIDGIREGTVTAGSIWDNFLNNLYRNFIRFLLQSAMAGKASGIMNMISNVLGMGTMGSGGTAPAGASIVGGQVTFHDGGFIGADSGRWLPGMKSDERMIRAQVGESVVPKGGSQNNVAVDVNVINNGPPVNVTKKQTQMDGPRTVIDLWIEGHNQNIGGIQKIVGGR